MNESKLPRPIRLWPGVIIVLFQWIARYGVPRFFPEALPFGAMAGLGSGILVLAWWVLFSRAPWAERIGAVVLSVAALTATMPLLDVSIATAGQGMLFYMYAVPLSSLAFVGWAVATRNMVGGMRCATMAATIVLATGVWALMRTGGITGDLHSDFAFRWSQTPEERLLAAGDVDASVADVPLGTLAGTEADWPGFRGAGRDSVIPGVRIETDWSASPPVEIWRRAVGPGWSSFAVGGGILYTQEQRGDEEIVAAYDVPTGEPVWTHRDPVRFYESNGGAGPRGTPTLRDGRVYTFGATGIVNALDAGSGALIWSANVVDDAEKRTPGWGFASSPLVVDDVVIIAAAGRMIGYDRDSGAPRWLGPDGGWGYSSPHAMTIHGVEQVVLLATKGAHSVDPATGQQLWEHAWPGDRMVQPAMLADGELLLSAAGDAGGLSTRRIRVSRDANSWRTEERWTSNRLKPYFNDSVPHEGYAYGFDGRILSCIDLQEGKRIWKGGRYGHGQLVLLPDQDVLLVLSEDGDLALVAAKPDGFTELARVPALDGKTWNHPVLVGDVLLIRNGREMAAFRLSPPST